MIRFSFRYSEIVICVFVVNSPVNVMQLHSMLHSIVLKRKDERAAKHRRTPHPSSFSFLSVSTTVQTTQRRRNFWTLGSFVATYKRTNDNSTPPQHRPTDRDPTTRTCTTSEAGCKVQAARIKGGYTRAKTGREVVEARDIFESRGKYTTTSSSTVQKHGHGKLQWRHSGVP